MKYIFFDLDGTLLPMDQDVFAKAYLEGLAKKMVPYGYEPKRLIQAIWKSTQAMVANDGTLTNETVFWNTFPGIVGKEVLDYASVFEDFYIHEFQDIQHVCGFSQEACDTVKRIGKQYPLILATNPLFPKIATESRIRWAGLSSEDFELVTTYETSCFCKPNPAYYQSLCNQLHVDPKEVLMVGNDVIEDLAARQVGMDVFLLTDCLINPDQRDLTDIPHGSFQDLLQYLNL